MKDRMTEAERFQAVYDGRKPDRTPIVAFAGAYAARLAGLHLKDFYTDPERCIRVQQQAKSLHGYDDGPHYGWADWGAWEFGGGIHFPREDYECAPRSAGALVERVSDVDALKVPDPRSAGMYPLLMEFNRKISALGYPAKIQGGTVSLLAAAIIGKERLMRWFIKEPQAVHRVYDMASDFILKAAEMTVSELGTACSVGFSAAMDTNELISPSIFETFCFPYLKKVNEGLMNLGLTRFHVHLCGNHRWNLPLWAGLPWPPRTTFSIGSDMGLSEVAEAFGHRHIVAGNVSTTRLALGTYEEVFSNVQRIVDEGKELPGGFVLMPACEMPVMAPPVNVHAMVTAGKKFGAYGQ